MELQIKKGKVRKPFLLIVYGTSGIGKTLFATSFDNPICFDIEQGASEIGCDRLEDFADFNQVIEFSKEIQKSKYATAVYDSLDRLEFLIWKQVVIEYNASAKHKVKSVADIPYGGGYALALTKWQEFQETILDLRKEKNVILVAHSLIKTINDPNAVAPYDKHIIKIHQKAADLLKETADAVLFAHYEQLVDIEDGKAKGKAVGEAKRVLYTIEGAGYQAKNRFGLPEILPLNQKEFMKALGNSKAPDIKEIQQRVSNLINLVKDDKTKKKALDYYNKNKNNTKKLLATENKLQVIVAS